ncbi:sensor histidine kinase [Erythrobacter sp. MTPC3]|uniref:sensor histidine kinase n=1 Tax=Erythrobacter sp. MTPC3 TaxID=3056564 RepID=UPI0036F2A53F
MTVAENATWPVGTPPASNFCSDDERLMVLASYGFDALAGDDELAGIAGFAAKLCEAPIALVSIVEAERQRFLVAEGLEETETPREWSFCAHAMQGGVPMIVQNALDHPTFAANPLVTGPPHIRFYAGIPLISSEGAPLGTLCVIDTEPRSEPLSDIQLEGFTVLAQATRRRLDAHRQAGIAGAEMEQSAERVNFVLNSVPDIAWSADANGAFDYVNARWGEITGLPAPTNVEDWRAAIHPDEYESSLAKFTHALANTEMFEDEWRLRRADGSYRWVLSRAVPSSSDQKTARWYGTITDIDDAHRISEERELLAGELAHRIKNIFTVIIGLISMHSRGDATIQAFGEMLSDNIRALSRAQEFALKLDGPTDDDLAALLAILMAPYGVAGKSAINISGEEVAVGKRAATPLALVFHELATNSAKYGSLSVAEGRLAISVTRAGDNVVIKWCETNGPATLAPEATGFGSRLINMAIRNQLTGGIEHDWRAEGLCAVITIPAERLAE